MSQDRPSAPNYTDTVIVLFGINLFWILCVLWAVVGYAGALIVAYVVKFCIDRLNVRSSRRAS